MPEQEAARNAHAVYSHHTEQKDALNYRSKVKLILCDDVEIF